MRPPLRVAILECDTPADATVQRYGTYGTIFQRLLENGEKALAAEDVGYRVELDVTKYNVVDHEIYPALEDVDAILLTGSKHNSFDNDPWILKLVEFTKKVLAQDRVRLIGVCFGHQIIGRALDVKVDRNEQGWEVAVVPVELTQRGKEILGLEKMDIHQMHRDIVYTYPPTVEPLGHTANCQVQGMYAKNRLITVQGHPEFNSEIMEEICTRRHGQGIFDDAAYKEALGRTYTNHNGPQVAAAFIKFLLEK